jgi:hypothetical protein
MRRTATRPAAVKRLSAEGRRLFDALTAEYGIGDAGGIQILLSGLTSLDLARQAEGRLKAEGLTVTSRLGEVKLHPAATAARDHRAAWLSALRSLNLAIGDVPTPGRPGGGQ